MIGRVFRFSGRMVLFLALSAGHGVADQTVSPATPAPPYVPEQQVQGHLSLAGSRTMSELAAIWVDAFRHIHPRMSPEFSFSGSESAMGHLQSGKPTIGLLSREVTQTDKDEFQNKHPGTKLIAIETGYDALAVIVHPQNPAEKLSLAQLQLLFANSNPADSVTWGSVGLDEPWSVRAVKRIGPGANSGAHQQFLNLVLPGKGFASMVLHDQHPQVVTDVGKDESAIGFVRLANSESDAVRVVPISADSDSTAVLPGSGGVDEGGYPLIRPLTLVIAVAEGSSVSDPLVAEFVRYVLSQNGQEDVLKSGFQPLRRAELLEQFDRLGWNTEK